MEQGNTARISNEKDMSKGISFFGRILYNRRRPGGQRHADLAASVTQA